jgi:hypothetical protein
LQTAQAIAQSKVCKRACYAHPEKQKISPLTEKNKTLPNHSPTDINVMIEIVEKKIHLSLDRKEGQLVTANKLKQGGVLRRTEKW